MKRSLLLEEARKAFFSLDDSVNRKRKRRDDEQPHTLVGKIFRITNELKDCFNNSPNLPSNATVIVHGSSGCGKTCLILTLLNNFKKVFGEDGGYLYKILYFAPVPLSKLNLGMIGTQQKKIEEYVTSTPMMSDELKLLFDSIREECGDNTKKKWVVVMDDFFVTKRADESTTSFGQEYMIDHGMQDMKQDELTRVNPLAERYNKNNDRKKIFNDIITNRTRKNEVAMRSSVTHKKDGIRVILQSLANKYNFSCFITAQSSVGEDLAPLVRNAKIQIFMWDPSSLEAYRKLMPRFIVDNQNVTIANIISNFQRVALTFVNSSKEVVPPYCTFINTQKLRWHQNISFNTWTNLPLYLCAK